MSGPARSTEQESYGRIFQLLDQPDCSHERLSEEIQQHTRLSNRLLREANSIAIALPHQITRLEHAIALLGQRRVRDALGEMIRYDRPSQQVKPPTFTRDRS